MKLQYIYIIFLLSMLSCKSTEQPDNVKIVGNPDSTVLNQYFSNESVCKYIFNDMIECSVVVNDSGPYHCFINENVLGKKQIYYFCIDDVVKYNYIPEYDSLNYDLSLTHKDTQSDSTKWSTKFEKISLMRKQSKEYNKLIETLDDAKDLSDFYNNSLFFQTNITSVDNKTKQIVLNKLIEITQVQLVGKYLRSIPNYENAIVLGWRYVSYTYDIQYWKSRDRLDLQAYASELTNRLFFYKISRSYFFPEYLQSIQEQNLNYISNLFKDIDNLYDQYDFCISVNYRYSDTRFFFFKIDWEKNNKITIHKNYINKEFLPTTRISNYYLYY